MTASGLVADLELDELPGDREAVLVEDYDSRGGVLPLRDRLNDFRKDSVLGLLSGRLDPREKRELLSLVNVVGRGSFEKKK